MRLPHQLIENLAFVSSDAAELISGLAGVCSAEEFAEIHRLFDLGLPPVTSLNALSVMTGYNPGFVWSLVHRAHRHYRLFQIPKGAGVRQIEAPRVALKAIQKWLSVHFERRWTAQQAVHGFVKGRSHITAAKVHLGSEWVISADIENCFPSTTAGNVRAALTKLGYQTGDSLNVLTPLLCYGTRLSQGAPTSPVISNIALDSVDSQLTAYAAQFGLRFTRYADDIVISGRNDQLDVAGGPEAIFRLLRAAFAGTSWTLSERKLSFDQLPKRLKVHGLLVHGEVIRLTKGYRNRIRLYRHLLASGLVMDEDLRRVRGHLNYAEQIDRAAHRES